MSIDNGISSAYINHLSSQTSSKVDGNIQNIQKKDYSQSSDEELMEACKEFEAYFVEQMYKAMQKTVEVLKDDESSTPNTSLVDFFKGNTLQELAAISTEQESLGLAQMLYEQMKRNYEI